MLNVAYLVTAGSTSHEAGSASPVVGIDVRASLDAPVNSCRVMFHGGATLEAEPGDPLEVGVGYDGDLETVFTGKIASVASGLGRVEVEAYGAFAALVATRLNLLYEEETAGGIVRDVLGLLGLLGVGEGKIEEGLKFPTFAMDDRAFLWTHLAGLARRCGFDLWADGEDQAHFRAYDPATTHTFRYGVDLLGHELDVRPSPIAGVEVYGASPAGQGQGDDASSWATKKEVKGSAGESTGTTLRLIDPAARTQKLAGDVAKGAMAGYGGTARGRVTVLGAPAVRLGDAARLDKLPISAQNGVCRVTGVRHRLGARVGFVTDVSLERR